MRFNPQQQAIIDYLGKNIIVAASAGAGKTTVLIGRLIKRIQQDHLEMSQICAMTFTEKAASEMKKRLGFELNKAYKETGSEFLKQQLTALQTAQISTIHSFCLSVIKEFGYLIGFNDQRSQNIISNEQKKIIEDRALTQVLDYHLENNRDNLYQLAQTFSFQPLDLNTIRTEILKLYEQSRIHLDSEGWLTQISNLYQAKRFEELPQSYQDIHLNILEINVDYYQQLITHLLDVYQYETEKEDEVAYQQIITVQESLAHLKQALLSHDLAAVAKQAKATFDLKIKSISKEDAYKEARQRYFKAFQDNSDMFFYHEDVQTILHTQKQTIETLVSLVKDYSRIIDTIKQEESVIDFNDIEHYAYDILNHPSGFASSTLQARYEEIMVDEFQDSNFFQEAIINKISRANNVFRVGDIKQSIYGFRHAKPDIMRSHLENRDQSNKVFYLSNNFRSKENIVIFNNELFDKLMNIKEFKDAYGVNDHVQVGIDQQKIDHVNVTLHCPENKQDLIIHHPDGRQESKQVTSAKLLAHVIAQDIEKQVRDGHNYRDICILVRSHARKDELQEAFDLRNIPYFFNTKEGFTHAFSVQDVLNFISFLQNPTDEFYLTYVLLSAFGGYDEIKISELKLHQRQPLIENLKTFDSSLYDKFLNLRSAFMKLSLSAGLNMIYSFNQYYHHHCGVAQKSNLDLLASKVSDYERKPHQGWAGFLEMMNFISKDDDSSFASAIDENEDVVKVLTIHQSKGLQFPIVYYFMNQSNRINNLSDSLIIDSELGVSFLATDRNQLSRRNHLLHHIIQSGIALGEYEESLRLLYVALTRAQHQLHCVSIENQVTEPLSAFHILRGEGHMASLLKVLHNHKFSIPVDIKTPVLSEVTVAKTVKEEIQPFQPLQKTETKTDEIQVPFSPTLDLSKGLSATEKGSLIHKILEQWPLENYETSFLQTHDLNDQQIQQLIAYRDHPLTQQFMKHEAMFEVSYALNENGINEFGIMDYVAIMDDEIILVDFKSDLVSHKQTLIDRYKSQINRYMHVLKKEYPDTRITPYLYSLVLRDYISL